MNMRKILSIILCAIMVVAIVPASIFMASAADITLYSNEFDTAMNPNGGSNTGTVWRTDDTDHANDGKVLVINGGGVWNEPVTLDNNTGALTIEMRYYNNNFANATSLSLNGVALLQGNASANIIIGETNVSNSAKAYIMATITVTIADLSTGVASVKFVDQDSNTYTGTVTVGAIADSIALSMGSADNSFRVDYIKVTQAEVDETTGGGEAGGDEEWAGGDLYTNDFSDADRSDNGTLGSSATISDGILNMAGWTGNGTWTHTVALKDQGIVTLSVKARANWQTASGPVLTLNGTVLVKNGGVVADQTVYATLVDGTNVETTSGSWDTITVTLDPVTGEGTVTYIDTTAEFTLSAGVTSLTIALGDTGNSTAFDDVSVYQAAYVAPTVPEIKVQGYQQTKAVDGKYNVRFVATGTVLDGVEAVGFEIEVAGKAIDVSGTTVYESITANYGTESVTAASYGADYITAIAITNIPTSEGDLTFTVKPYVVVGGEKQYGATETTTVEAPVAVTTIYANDFSTDAEADGAVLNTACETTQISDGKLYFMGWGVTDEWSVTKTVNSTGLVTITLKVYPNWAKSGNVLTINGTTVVTSASVTQVGILNGTTVTAYNSITNTDDYSGNISGLPTTNMVTITVTLDPATGAGTVEYYQNDVYTTRTGSFTLDAFTELTVELGCTTRRWAVESIEITQK